MLLDRKTPKDTANKLRPRSYEHGEQATPSSMGYLSVCVVANIKFVWNTILFYHFLNKELPIIRHTNKCAQEPRGRDNFPQNGRGEQGNGPPKSHENKWKIPERPLHFVFHWGKTWSLFCMNAMKKKKKGLKVNCSFQEG